MLLIDVGDNIELMTIFLGRFESKFDVFRQNEYFFEEAG